MTIIPRILYSYHETKNKTDTYHCEKLLNLSHNPMVFFFLFEPKAFFPKTSKTLAVKDKKSEEYSQ